MRWIIPLSILIFFELVADVLAKEWSLHGSAIRWLGAISAFVVANAFWLFALRNGSGLGREAIIFSVALTGTPKLRQLFSTCDMLWASCQKVNPSSLPT